MIYDYSYYLGIITLQIFSKTIYKDSLFSLKSFYKIR